MSFPCLAFGRNFKCVLEVEAMWSSNRLSHASASKVFLTAHEVFLTANNKIPGQYSTTEAFSLSIRLECSKKGKVAFSWEIPEES